MTSIGFIGLGTMGKPMVKRLLAAGHVVAVHNRSQAAVDELVAIGAGRASSPEDVARQSDVIITMLPSDAEVFEVITGEAGVLAAARQGATVVDMSTTLPETAKSLAERCAAQDVHFLDAPVSGGEVGAQQGTLSIMVGGSEPVLDGVLPILESMGSSVVHVGQNGAGQLTKSANQMIVGVTIAAVSEAFVLAEKSGVDLVSLRKALLGGFANSRILDLHGQRIIERNFEPGFRAELHLKDLEIAATAAESCNLHPEITLGVRDLFRQMVAKDMGGRDHSALFEFIGDSPS